MKEFNRIVEEYSGIVFWLTVIGNIVGMIALVKWTGMNPTAGTVLWFVIWGLLFAWGGSRQVEC